VRANLSAADGYTRHGVVIAARLPTTRVSCYRG